MIHFPRSFVLSHDSWAVIPQLRTCSMGSWSLFKILDPRRTSTVNTQDWNCRVFHLAVADVGTNQNKCIACPC